MVRGQKCPLYLNTSADFRDCVNRFLLANPWVPAVPMLLTKKAVAGVANHQSYAPPWYYAGRRGTEGRSDLGSGTPMTPSPICQGMQSSTQRTWASTTCCTSWQLRRWCTRLPTPGVPASGSAGLSSELVCKALRVPQACLQSSESSQACLQSSETSQACLQSSETLQHCFQSSETSQACLQSSESSQACLQGSERSHADFCNTKDT